MSDGEVYLRWNNHNSTFMSSLASLFLREQWVDVTLAAQGKFINVHRLVLCACSQYFEVQHVNKFYSVMVDMFLMSSAFTGRLKHS